MIFEKKKQEKDVFLFFLIGIILIISFILSIIFKEILLFIGCVFTSIPLLLVISIKMISKEIKQKRLINELRYFAGFIDGEGCVYIGGRKEGYRGTITVVNTNKKIIDSFLNVFGGNIRFRKGKEKNKDIYVWQLNNSNILEFCERMEDLIKIKKPQLKILKQLQKTMNSDYSKRKNVPQKILAEREKLYLKIRKLNKRGKNVERM